MTTPRITIHGYDLPEDTINSTESLFSMISTLQSISHSFPNTPPIYVQTPQTYTNSPISVFIIGEDAVYPEQEPVRTPVELNINSQPYSREKLGETCESCVICSEEYTEGVGITLLGCSHSFHTSCIREWGCYKQDCPICRTHIPTLPHN